MSSRLAPLCSIVLFLLTASVMKTSGAERDSDREIANRLIAEALKPSPLESNLRRLTDEIGGRIPGTPAFQRAVDWATTAFKEAGADSVHTEEFTIEHSWAEGATEMTASLYSGAAFHLPSRTELTIQAKSSAKPVSSSIRPRIGRTELLRALKRWMAVWIPNIAARRMASMTSHRLWVGRPQLPRIAISTPHVQCMRCNGRRVVKYSILGR